MNFYICSTLVGSISFQYPMIYLYGQIKSSLKVEGVIFYSFNPLGLIFVTHTAAYMRYKLSAFLLLT